MSNSAAKAALKATVQSGLLLNIYKHVIDVNNNISCNIRGEQRIASAVALKLKEAVAYQE